MSYKVKFDTGQVVEFQNMPTDADIEDVVKKLGIKPKKAEAPQEQQAPKGTGSIGGDILRGIGKGATSTVLGLGQLALKGYSAIPGLPGKELVKQSIATGEDIKATQLKPETTAEAVGKTAEQIGEFLIPTGTQAKALSLLQKAVPGLAKSTKISGGFARLLTKSVASGAEFGGKTVLQTGGDMGQAIDSALVGFVATPIMTGVGKVFKAVTKTLPEKLYSQIFKTAQDDLQKYYQTVARGQKLNPTLAKEALDRGLKGSSKNMAVYSIKKLDQLEKAVQQTVKGSTKKIVLENKKGYIEVLKTIKNQFKSGFLSGRAKEADKLIKELSTTKTKEATMDTALKLRRFIDAMRNTSSFRIDPKLTPRQEEFKFAADSIRKKLSEAGLKDLMNEERVFIEAVEAIVSDAAKRNNKTLLNLTDVLLGGGGVATGFPGAGFGAMAGVRAFQQPFSLTNLAQILFKSGNAIESVVPFLEQLPKAIPPLMR